MIGIALNSKIVTESSVSVTAASGVTVSNNVSMKIGKIVFLRFDFAITGNLNNWANIATIDGVCASAQIMPLSAPNALQSGKNCMVDTNKSIVQNVGNTLTAGSYSVSGIILIK